MKQRQEMHAKNLSKENISKTDSEKMFDMGVAGGIGIEENSYSR